MDEWMSVFFWEAQISSITTAPVLVYPSFGPGKEFALETDTS